MTSDEAIKARSLSPAKIGRAFEVQGRSSVRAEAGPAVRGALRVFAMRMHRRGDRALCRWRTRSIRSFSPAATRRIFPDHDDDESAAVRMKRAGPAATSPP